MPQGNQQKQPKYSYLPLDAVQSNTKVNVYGVVKFAKQPYKSRGSDYCMMLSIVDQTMTGHDQKLKCLLFAHAERLLPPAQVGDIIRFHRLTITKFAGDLQGQSAPGYSWVLFSGDPGGSLEPKAKSSQNVTIPDEEEQKIEYLRQWASGQGLAKTYARFKNIAAGCYFDSICQVISTCLLEEDVCLLLRVWDGTQTIYPVREVDTSTAEGQMNTDYSLSSKADGFVYDLCLFDDHVKTGKKIKPGDYIELCNLHAAIFKTPGVTPLDTFELVLHRGTSFGRGVRVLDTSANIAELGKLKQDLEKIIAQYASQASMNDSELVRAAENVQGNNAEYQVQKKGSNVVIDSQRPSTSRVDNSQGRQQCCDSSESVQIIENVQNSEVGSSSEEIVEISDPAGSSSSDSVQIIENVQTSDDKSQADRTKFKRKENESENGQKAKNLKLSKESTQKRTQNKGLRTDQNTDIDIAVDRTVDEGQNDLEIQSAQNSGTVETDSSVERQSGSIPRCMMKTATVILSHPHVQRTRISDVLKHEVPYKFKLRARVYDYHPKPTSVDQFLQLYCNVCHHLCPMPGLVSTDNSQADSQLQIGSTFKGVPHYNCPRCLTEKDSLQELDSPPHLSYIYMMRLLLRDDTGWLLANIWKDDAETFFRDITPEELIQNKKQLKFISECLQQICPENCNQEDKPWIECCVRSFSNSEGTGYQIFDTVIA